MFLRLKVAFLGIMAAAVFMAAPAMSQTISQTNNDSAFSFNDGQARFAQIVIAPNTRITALSVAIENFGGRGTVTPQIFAWSGSSLTGSALFTGESFPVTNGTLNYTIPVGSVPVTTGSQYALVFTATGNVGNFPIGAGDRLPGSELRFSSSASETALSMPGQGTDAVFSVTFSAAPVAAVPTMSEWAMIILATMMAGGAALYLQRRYSAN